MRARLFDVVTFDCYGTLIDWEAGIGVAFTRAAASAGLPIDTGTASPINAAPFPLDSTIILEAYSETEPRVQSERFRCYRDVLGETARRVADRLGWRLPPGGETFLAESLGDWLPFPDTNPALRRLVESGYRLGILSNVDDDLLAATCRHFGVSFDLRITAQQVRSYKPAPGHFLKARETIGSARWLHAAQSHFHDVTPAVPLGIPTAWINRKSEKAPPGSPRPTREFRNLTELADWLAP